MTKGIYALKCLLSCLADALIFLILQVIAKLIMFKEYT